MAFSDGGRALAEPHPLDRKAGSPTLLEPPGAASPGLGHRANLSESWGGCSPPSAERGSLTCDPRSLVRPVSPPSCNFVQPESRGHTLPGPSDSDVKADPRLSSSTGLRNGHALRKLCPGGRPRPTQQRLPGWRCPAPRGLPQLTAAPAPQGLPRLTAAPAPRGLPRLTAAPAPRPPPTDPRPL